MLIALLTLFFWSFLAATILPLSSEAALLVYIGSYEQVGVPVLVATAGNYLGACTTYWIGRRTAKALGKVPSQTAENTRGATLMRRFGPPTLLLSWVPILGDALVALAGAMRLPFSTFSFWVALGKGLRYLAVAGVVASIL